jgi:hypothetical protein
MAQTVLAPIDIDERAGQEIQLPAAAAVHLYPGTLIARDSSGDAIYATDTAGLEVMGRCQGDVDNSAGIAGALNVNVRRGVFAYFNSSTEPLAQANVGSVCFVQDEQTVASTSTNLVKAGIFLGINSDTGMAWVDTSRATDVPSADTLTALGFTTPTAAECTAFKTAVIAILKAQGLII